MKHTDLKELFKNHEEYLGKTETVCGWVRTARDSKNMCFLEVNDGTTLNHLQIVIDKSLFEKEQYADLMNVGVGMKVVGELVMNMSGNGVEMNAHELTLLGECPNDYPLQKKRHGMEFLRTIPHLRVRTNTFHALLQVRSKLAQGIHQFFMNNNFTYIHTPIITGSDCEGAGEIFRVTTHKWDHKAQTEVSYYEEDFFGRKAGLTVSGQLEGEVAAMSMGKIYTFGPTFRAENSNTSRHAAEFWQIEPEVAFAELPDIMEIAENMIKYIIDFVLKECPQEMAFFEKFMEPGLLEKLNKVINSDFAVIDYTKAIEILKESRVEFHYPVEWGVDLQTEHERYLAEEICKRPVFITNYPKEIKSFYMKQNMDGTTVAATDLLVPGVGEIIGCSERENHLGKLVKAMEDRNMNMDDYKDYLDLRKFGSVPHSGFGLGFERMLMYLTGISNIRDVTLYPRTTGDLK